MIPLSTAVFGTLTWSKTSCGRNSELKLNGEVVGTLNRPSFWSEKYLAESHDGQWMFRRGGFLGSGSQIVETSSGQPIATYKSNWGLKGTLTFTDGQTFHVESRGFWRPVWTVSTEAGEPVLRLHTREETVETTSAAPDNRLSLLMMFACYCVLRAQEDAAVAVVIAAS